MELEIGFLVERFQQTPYQLGLSETQDTALLYRALQAVAVYRAARAYLNDMTTCSNEQWDIITRVRRELKRGYAKRNK